MYGVMLLLMGDFANEVCRLVKNTGYLYIK